MQGPYPLTPSSLTLLPSAIRKEIPEDEKQTPLMNKPGTFILR